MLCLCDSCWLVGHPCHGKACEAEPPTFYEDGPLAIGSRELVGAGFAQAVGLCLEAGGEGAPPGFAGPVLEGGFRVRGTSPFVMSTRVVAGDRVVRELSGWQPLELEELEAKRKAEPWQCDPRGVGKVPVCLPAVAKGGKQSFAGELSDVEPLDPLEVAVLEAEGSAVDVAIRETFAGVNRRRKQVERVLLQRAADMRALCFLHVAGFIGG